MHCSLKCYLTCCRLKSTCLSHILGIIRTQELLDHETTSHYWLTVYAMDRGVVPLSSSVEVYIEVQDVNDNAPQTSEPVYYPSIMENTPKDVSIIQIEAVDPDAQASDKLTFRITSGNPQGFFAINSKTGKVAVNEMEFRITINGILCAGTYFAFQGKF